ncbi:MAG: VCBS repeat-containing protein [Planctomycetaceae bacterium]
MISTAADGAYSVFAADVDGDGDLDILSASSRDDTIAWYENDGNQVFTKRVISTAADGAYSVFAADVDGDGDLDVLSASYSDDTIAWYETTATVSSQNA